MINVNSTGVFDRQQPATRKGRKLGAWAIALALAWLALLAVPIAGLSNLDAFAPTATDTPKPWMPIYPPII